MATIGSGWVRARRWTAAGMAAAVLGCLGLGLVGAEPERPPATYVPLVAAVPLSERPALVLADVVRLMEAKVADDVIARFVARRRLAAELTADDLIHLTEKGASPVVFAALQSMPVAPAGPSASPVPPGAAAPEAARYGSPAVLH